MRESHDVFHLAIPAFDLDEAQHFYVDLLGCKLARRYPDRITIDFFGDQLVCHRSEPSTPRQGPLELYPRHFGVSFANGEDFDALVHLIEQRKLEVFQPVTLRFEGMVEVHRTVVLRDPSDNLIEFKHYEDKRMMY